MARIRKLGMDGHPRLLAIVKEALEKSAGEGSAQVRQEQRSDDEPGCPTIAVDPRDPAAAAVELSIDGAIIAIAVGPKQYVHEVPLTSADWELQVREVLEAVFLGRYEEAIERSRFGTRLTMTFETPRRDITVKHLSLDGPPPAPMRRRFGPYLATEGDPRGRE